MPVLDGEVVETLGDVEPQRPEGIEIADVGAPAPHCIGDLGQGPFEQPGHLQQPPTARLVGAEQADQ